MKTVRLIIKGRVQGVFYRASAKDAADALGITGWVRNLPDHRVEIVASARQEILLKFIEWCREGPPRALVEEVVVEESAFEEYKNFRILR